MNELSIIYSTKEELLKFYYKNFSEKWVRDCDCAICKGEIHKLIPKTPKREDGKW